MGVGWGGKYDKSVNTSVILVLCGGGRGTPACGMAAPGGRRSVSSPGEHETGLPANMLTATFIPGELPVGAARLLAASFYLIGLARCGADSAHTQVHVCLKINHTGEPAATGIIVSQLLVVHHLSASSHHAPHSGSCRQ